jgi:ABC-2 type transport system ATP-binding protein
VGELVGAWAQLRERPTEALRRQCESFALSLDDLGRVPFRSLSGGMQQKLLAAMALASPATVLFFDEPTANLDPQAREVFLAALAERRPRPTVVLSSHRIDELSSLVDRVVTLAEGRVAGDESAAAFLASTHHQAMAGVAPGTLPFRRPS